MWLDLIGANPRSGQEVNHVEPDSPDAALAKKKEEFKNPFNCIGLNKKSGAQVVLSFKLIYFFFDKKIIKRVSYFFLVINLFVQQNSFSFFNYMKRRRD